MMRRKIVRPERPAATKACAISSRPRSVPPAWTAFLVLAASLFLVPGTAHAQSDFKVNGVITDTAGAALSGAMVVALAKPDSVLTKFTTTNSNGIFVLDRLAAGEYILQVTLIGHETIRQDISVTNADADAGTIRMSILAVDVDPLVVTLDHVPFLSLGDTLAYNVRAFPTRPNASVEDLLGQLPGVEVASDGSIKAQGEDVENVLVDGKEFFGSDPKIATKNLRADAVDKVEVYDKESDMAEFTGIPDGEEERTINLELKEEARRGHFGRVGGGLGADIQQSGALRPVLGESVPGGQGPTGASARGARVPYTGELTVNRFSPTTQLSFMGKANNVNQPGFGIEATLSNLLAGGGRLPGTGGGGLTESLSLGLNASRDFGSKNWIRTSYFFSMVDNYQNETRRQEQLLGAAASSLVNRAATTLSDNSSHRLNFNSQIVLAEGNELRLRGNFNASGSGSEGTDLQQRNMAGGQFVNSASTKYDTDADNLGGNAQLTWRKRLNDNGQSLVAEARLNAGNSDRARNLASELLGAGEPGGGGRDGGTRDILQEQTNTGRDLAHSVRLSLTQPLGRSTLEIFGERRAVADDEDQSVFDILPGGRLLNNRLSSGFEHSYTYWRGGGRFSSRGESNRLTLGARVQHSALSGTILDQIQRDREVATRYTHILPSALYTIQLSNARSIELRYSTSTQDPQIRDLQPFADNRDPLRITTGNPDLAPEYTHRLRAQHRFFDQFSFVGLLADASVSYTSNNIAQSRDISSGGVQTISPVNLGSAWSVSGGANFSRPLRWLGASVNLDYRVSYSVSSELVNQADNTSTALRHTASIELQNRSKRNFDVRGGASLSFNDVNYSLNEELSQGYLNTTMNGSADIYLGAWTLGTSINYRIFDQNLLGPGQNIALLQASISRFVLGDRAEIELAGFDLLGQNQGVTYTNSPEFIQERRSESLGPYVMLNFTYHIGSPAGGGKGISRIRG